MFTMKKNGFVCKTHKPETVQALLETYLEASSNKETGETVQAIWKWFEQNGLTEVRWANGDVAICNYSTWSYDSVAIDIIYIYDDEAIRHKAEFENREGKWFCISLNEEWV